MKTSQARLQMQLDANRRAVRSSIKSETLNMPSCKFAAWAARPDSRVAVIGAAGWIGQAFGDQAVALHPLLKRDRLRLFGSTARTMQTGYGPVMIEDLSRTEVLGPGEWLILHAGIAGLDRAGGDLELYRRMNDAMLDKVLHLAGSAEVRRLVFLSSGAAGREDLASPAKAAYADMKRTHEAAAARWSRMSGKALLTPRIFNLGGPYINHASNYALGDFITTAARGEDVVLKAPGPVFRSYVHVQEAAATLLNMAADPDEDGAPFDVAGARIVELETLAHAVARLTAPSVQVRRDNPGLAAEDWYVGDGRRYQTALFRRGRHPIALEAIIEDTAAYMRSAALI
jgi:nucleoside-diphosphate-sugar epimerase